MPKTNSLDLSEVERDIVDVIGADIVSLDEIKERVDAPDEQVENCLRLLLKRTIVGETADWKYFIDIRFLDAD